MRYLSRVFAFPSSITFTFVFFFVFHFFRSFKEGVASLSIQPVQNPPLRLDSSASVEENFVFRKKKMPTELERRRILGDKDTFGLILKVNASNRV